MNNPEKQQPRVHKTQEKYTLEHTEGAIKNEKSRETAI
jgi:hypothetical protein